MSSEKQTEATEKKPAARATRSRSRAPRSRSHRRKATPNAEQQSGMNGGEHEGSDYQTQIGLLNRYCAAKRITYGDVNIFELLAWQQQHQGQQTAQQQRSMTAGSHR
jgi:hypothetical protein